jgi:hypothetical protein
LTANPDANGRTLTPATVVELLATRGPVAGVKGQEFEISNETILIERSANDPLQFMVSALRNDQLPAVAEDGVTRALDLDENQDLAEQTHVRFSSKDPRVVLVVRTARTPGHIQASNAFSRMIDTGITLVALGQPDPTSLVRQSDGVVDLTVKYSPDKHDLDAIATSATLHRSAEMLTALSDVEAVSITLHARTTQERRGMRGLAIRIGDALTQIGTTASPGITARIVTEDNRYELVNLLEDQLVRRISTPIPQGAPRTLDPISIGGCMDQALSELMTPIGVALASIPE